MEHTTPSTPQSATGSRLASACATGGSATHAATYVAGGPGKCHVSIKRSAADDFVTAVLLRRLARPDAAELFIPSADVDTTAEMTELRQRSEDLGELVADGLLTASNARPKLAAIAERLVKIEAARMPARWIRRCS